MKRPRNDVKQIDAAFAELAGALGDLLIALPGASGAQVSSVDVELLLKRVEEIAWAVYCDDKVRP